MVQEQIMSPSADAPVVELVPVVLDQPMCGMCLHPLESHDAIATRYCEATASSALARGCVCRQPAATDVQS
jgi:hypothetical protein